MEGTWFSGEYLVNDEGIPLIWEEMTIVVNGEEPPISNETLSNVLCRLDLGETEQNGSIGVILIGALLYVIGAFTFQFPDQMHFGFSGWLYKNPELSEDGRAFEKFGGVVCMAVGFLMAANMFGLR